MPPIAMIWRERLLLNSDVRRAYDFAPLGNLVSEELAEVFGARACRVDAELDEALAQLGLAHGRLHLAAEQVDDRFRRSGGREDAHPRAPHHGYAGFHERRQL